MRIDNWQGFLVQWKSFYTEKLGLKVQAGENMSPIGEIEEGDFKEPTYILIPSLAEEEKFFRRSDFHAVFSPWTMKFSSVVGSCFPNEIISDGRPDEEYLLLVEGTKEVPEETLNRSAKDLKAYLQSRELVGLTLFEYLIFHFYRRDSDANHLNWILDSKLPDGRILCARKNHKYGEISIFAYPARYKEHNSQGARPGRIFKLP